jgi:hypothetical protein
LLQLLCSPRPSTTRDAALLSPATPRPTGRVDELSTRPLLLSGDLRTAGSTWTTDACRGTAIHPGNATNEHNEALPSSHLHLRLRGPWDATRKSAPRRARAKRANGRPGAATRHLHHPLQRSPAPSQLPPSKPASRRPWHVVCIHHVRLPKTAHAPPSPAARNTGRRPTVLPSPRLHFTDGRRFHTVRRRSRGVSPRSP